MRLNTVGVPADEKCARLADHFADYLASIEVPAREVSASRAVVIDALAWPRLSP